MAIRYEAVKPGRTFHVIIIDLRHWKAGSLAWRPGGLKWVHKRRHLIDVGAAVLSPMNILSDFVYGGFVLIHDSFFRIQGNCRQVTQTNREVQPRNDESIAFDMVRARLVASKALESALRPLSVAASLRPSPQSIKLDNVFRWSPVLRLQSSHQLWEKIVPHFQH